MKKLIALSILVSLFAVGVFAQDAEGAKADAKPLITITGSAEAALVPLQIVHSEGDTYVGAGLGRPEDTAEGPKVELNGRLNALDGKLGAKVDLLFFGGGNKFFTLGDNAELWFQPTDWFKLDAGIFVEDRLRGKIGRDNWYPWTSTSGQKDFIFSRFNAEVGVLLGFTPSQVKGLYIGVMVPRFSQFGSREGVFVTGKGSNLRKDGAGADGQWGTADDIGNLGDSWRAAQVYKGIQAAIGYEIEGTGLFRIQYVGSRNQSAGDWGTMPLPGGIKGQVNSYTPARIELAFAYTGMEGLVLDFGGKFWFPVDEYVGDTYNAADEKYGNGIFALQNFNGSVMLPVQISLGAEYTAIENVSIGGRIDTAFAGSASNKAGGDDLSLPFWLAVHLWPSYNLGFAWVGLDVGLQYTGDTKIGSNTVAEGGVDVGFGLWLKKGFGNSSIKGGVAYKVGTDHSGKEGVLSIPIVFDYSF